MATTANGTSEPITETITESNIDDIVETLYDGDELIGYACRQVLEQNTVEEMELEFYMDVMTPLANATTTSEDPQGDAIKASQEVLLREMSREFQIDPTVSKGVRCFDLPVDGSTWIVQMTIETKDFREETLFGGCRKLQWDPETQDCKFYEARMKGSYIGAVARAKDGTPFNDAIEALENLVNGPRIVENLSNKGGGLLAPSDYETLFVGFPRVADDPNFQGGADEGRDILNEPTNINTAIESSQSALRNRKTVTVVGGLLVGCFSLAFALVGYILYNRRRSYRKNNASREDDAFEGREEAGLEAGEHYNLDKEDKYKGTDDGDEHQQHEEGLYDDEPEQVRTPRRQQQPKEYPNLPMSAEAIQMDLGNALKGQLMGLHAPNNFRPDYEEDDDSDSWAQTDGTISSLDPFQLEPITSEI